MIGIIGGAGVAATNKLLTLIEEQFVSDGAFRDCHHPEMLVWQATKAPSRSMYLEGRGESFIDDYVQIARKLRDCGATMLCMNCNTAHYAIEEISARSGMSFINLIEEVAHEIKRRQLKKVGLVASDGCLIGKVYETWVQKCCPWVELIYPDAEFQKLSTLGICNTKNHHRLGAEESPERPRTIFSRVHQHLLDKGAETVVMGCTDIGVDYCNEMCIDSLRVLADAIIRETREK